MSLRTFKYITLFLAVIFSSSGCRLTRYVPENEYLLNNIDIKVDNKEIDNVGLKDQLRQKENVKIFGFLRFHLWVYNLSSKKKENGFLKRNGEAPVIYDENLTMQSLKQMEQYMHNRGYYEASIGVDTKKHRKKTDITFSITANQPFNIKDINYKVEDSWLVPDINECLENTLIKSGDILDLDKLSQERTRIAKALTNSGYYKFSEDYIIFTIDTLQGNHEASVTLIVRKAANPETAKLDSPHKRYTIDSFDIYYEQRREGNSVSISPQNSFVKKDSIDGYSFYSDRRNIPLKNSLIKYSVANKPCSLYSKKADENSYNRLYGLRQFSLVNIQYQEIKDRGDSLNGFLKGKIYLPMQSRQSYSVDIEGTTSAGNYGIAGNINYQHKNLLHGAEVFDITLRGAIEKQTADFTKRELGAEAKLLIPGFLFPFNHFRSKLSSMPQTRYSIAFNYQGQYFYTRTIANATYGYQWRGTSQLSHYFNLFDINIVRMLSINPEFEVKDLYIKSSYTDHVIFASNYTLIYNNQSSSNKNNYTYAKFGFETAGNTLWSFCKAFNRQQYTIDDTPEEEGGESFYYNIFGTRFAQYIKGDVEFHKGISLGEKHALAFRTFAGIGLPYGNYDVIPFERRYFTGGSNGIRAWQVRSLGPGSYSEGATEYHNQSSDIKLEANIEYRFKVVWLIEGALFLDGGNIWAINDKDKREGALFKFDSFYKEFALGTGLGIRIVAPYFIIRADMGLKLRDPSLEEGKRWIPSQRSFKRSDATINIAVGYPF